MHTFFVRLGKTRPREAVYMWGSLFPFMIWTWCGSTVRKNEALAEYSSCRQTPPPAMRTLASPQQLAMWHAPPQRHAVGCRWLQHQKLRALAIMAVACCMHTACFEMRTLGEACANSPSRDDGTKLAEAMSWVSRIPLVRLLANMQVESFEGSRSGLWIHLNPHLGLLLTIDRFLHPYRPHELARTYVASDSQNLPQHFKSLVLLEAMLLQWAVQTRGKCIWVNHSPKKVV